MAKKTSKLKKQKTSPLSKIALFILVIPLLFIGMSSIIMLLIAMIPTILSMPVSGKSEPLKWVCVGAFNLAGLLPYLFDLWAKGNSLEALAVVLFNIQAFVMIYSFALLGLLIYFIIPFIVDFILNMLVSSRISKIERVKQDLTDLWGKSLVSVSKKVMSAGKAGVDIYEEEEKEETSSDEDMPLEQSA